VTELAELAELTACMAKSYTEEKFKVMGLNGRKVEVVFDRIPDADADPSSLVTELTACLRIQEVNSGNNE
jgi:hypothetical protein